MYTLTLTGDERDAFDWVGNRYLTGNRMSGIIKAHLSDSHDDDEFDYWNEPGDVTFDIPEYAAWEMKELADSEDGFWPCFADTLASKMQTFIDNIV